VGVAAQLLNHEDLAGGPSALGRNGMTALHCAALHGNVQVCQKLLGNPLFAEVNSSDRWGRTALHLAAEQGHAAVCCALVASPRFSKVNAYNRWHCTAEQVAKNEETRQAIADTIDAQEEGGLGAEQQLARLKECFRLIAGGDEAERLQELLADVDVPCWSAWRNAGGCSLLEFCMQRKRFECNNLLRGFIDAAEQGDSESDEEGAQPVCAMFRDLNFHSIEPSDFKNELINEYHRLGVSDQAVQKLRVKLREGSDGRVLAWTKGDPDSLAELRATALGQSVRVAGSTATLEEQMPDSELPGQRAAPDDGSNAAASVNLPFKTVGPPGPAPTITAWRREGQQSGGASGKASAKLPAASRSGVGAKAKVPAKPTASAKPASSPKAASSARQPVTSQQSRTPPPGQRPEPAKSVAQLSAELKAAGVNPARLASCKSRAEMQALLNELTAGDGKASPKASPKARPAAKTTPRRP